MDPAGVAIFLS